MIKHNSFTLILMQSGMIVSLPVLMTGYMCGQKYGFNASIIGIIPANFLIALFSFITIPQMVQTRLNTPEQFKLIFGKLGCSFNAIASLISLIGWFAINLNIMNESVALINQQKLIVLPVFLGVFSVLIVSKGIKRIVLVNYFFVPILFLYASYLIFIKVNNIPPLFFGF